MKTPKLKSESKKFRFGFKFFLESKENFENFIADLSKAPFLPFCRIEIIPLPKKTKFQIGPEVCVTHFEERYSVRIFFNTRDMMQLSTASFLVDGPLSGYAENLKKI